MASRQRRLYSALEERVRSLRKRHEFVWHWSEHSPGDVSIVLGPSRLRPAREAFWGASGRSLHFRKVAGRWTLVGEGCWRT